MNKKIIYLLSLLMALSLVFASCKKGSSGITGGDVPGEEPGTVAPPDLSSGGGLFTDQGKLEEYASKPVQASKIAEFGNNNYMRNPVITVIDGKTVVVFYEVRYESPGSANDTALTGTNVVDIAYTVSTDAGVSFDTSTSIKYVGPKATSPETSHGAPIVFYDKQNNKLVVVASAGIGLGVGSYSETDETKRSKLQYSVATVGSDGSISGFNTWIPMDKPANLTKDNVTFSQFGTHSARGTVTSDGTLLLPVTVGKFIQNDNGWGDSRWGYLLYTGKVSGDTVTWTEVENSLVVMKLEDKTKATRIASGTSQDSYVALTVSDASSPKLYQASTLGAVPAVTAINAGDGAAGTLVVKDWKGATPYNPADYAKTFGNEGSVQQSILSHVEVLEKQLAVRLVDTDFKTQIGGSFIPDEKYKNNSKSSTLDILGDGTIVLVAEGGKVNAGAKERQFYIHFYRYTQAYLTTQTGNAAN